MKALSSSLAARRTAVFCIVGAVAVFAVSCSSNSAALTPTEKFANTLARYEWDSVSGATSISLNGLEHTASVHVFVSDEKTLESTGTWSNTDNVVTIHANGEAGKFDLHLKHYPSKVGEFLTPVNSTLLKDCYVGNEPPPDNEPPERE